jgi:glycosyltransferase involved in cell wall biosynthesis
LTIGPCPGALAFNSHGYPLHIVQRGINREACFFAEEDYACDLHWRNEAARACGCAVPAYVLMTNQVHLLLTPAQEGAPAREVLREGEDGLLVDFFSPSGISDRVDEALDHPERMRATREAARRTIVERYDARDSIGCRSTIDNRSNDI